MTGIEIIPTVVPESLADIERAVSKYGSFAKMLHVDFADGVFATNTTWMPRKGDIFRAMPWEAHLMVSEPRELGARCISAGATRVIGHIEVMQDDARNILDAWRSEGAAEVGIALLAQTPLNLLDPYADACDFAMLMTIERIGVQGLPFYPRAPERVAALHGRHPRLRIEVDGAVNQATLPLLARAGATRFCAGSALSKSPDPASAYRAIAALAESALQ